MAVLKQLTPELIVAVVAAAIALALDVIPGLSAKWEELPKEVKRLTWLVACLLVGLAPWVLTCVLKIALQDGFIVVCTPEGLLDVLGLGMLAYFASQSTHGLVELGRKVVKWADGGDEIPF